jgi:tetratricopeptide (TPR) repeat protein
MTSSSDLSSPNYPDGNRDKADKLAIDYCNHGRNLLKVKKYVQARSAYQMALQCVSTLAIARYGYAQASYHLGDYSVALMAIDLAIESDLERTDFYYQRALIAKARNDFPQVLADCHQILNRDPQHLAARSLMAIALARTAKDRVLPAKFERKIDSQSQSLAKQWLANISNYQ